MKKTGAAPTNKYNLRSSTSEPPQSKAAATATQKQSVTKEASIPQQQRSSTASIQRRDSTSKTQERLTSSNQQVSASSLQADEYIAAHHINRASSFSSLPDKVSNITPITNLIASTTASTLTFVSAFLS